MAAQSALVEALNPSERILALETSCDETSAAVVSGMHILSNVISSQAALHEKWGGVVPEAAARAHVEALLPVVERAFEVGGIAKPGSELTAIAVTNRPGLVGALSVGVTAAKAFAMGWGLPLIGIHHLEGHLLSPLANGQTIPFPHISLVASGGHTELVLVRAMGDYEIVGQTIDDAAGEAFDKTARLLGLGYPGGRAIQDAAEGGETRRYSLPRGLSGDTLDFSFSGLKTAVLRLVEREGSNLNIPDAAASVQGAIASVLAERTVSGARAFGAHAVTLVGGVAANRRLRLLLKAECEKEGLPFFTPVIELCTDNAGMIGIAASFRLAKGERDTFALETMANADLP